MSVSELSKKVGLPEEILNNIFSEINEVYYDCDVKLNLISSAIELEYSHCHSGALLTADIDEVVDLVKKCL